MKRLVLPAYTLIRETGGGGMTDAYVAHDREHRRVLVRSPREDYLRDRKYLRHFSASAEILAQLDHPNIIRLVDRGSVDGRPFMVLEYVEARSCRELILGRDPWLAHHGLSVIRQLADGLYYLHHRGFLHLDLKPENLLARDDGHVVLVDFDLALPKQSRPIKLKQLPGTPAYLAPEALTKRAVDEQTDIYGFGVTAYELLTFHKPYEAATADELQRMQLDVSIAPTPMRARNPDIGAAVESLIFKCLAKQKNNRYPSMSLVVKDLKAIA